LTLYPANPGVKRAHRAIVGETRRDRAGSTRFGHRIRRV